MNILDLLSSHNIALKPKPTAKSPVRGAEYQCACPSCGGENCFHAWPEQGEGGTWWCRKCDKGGDLIAFLRHFEGLSFKAACERLGVKRDLPLRPLPKAPAPAVAAFAGADHGLPPAQWRERAAKLVEKAHAALFENSKAIEALARRGVEHTSFIPHRLGWLEGENGKDCLYRPRSAWGLPDLEAERDGLTVTRKTLWIPRGLVIPRFLDGQAVSLRIRRPDADAEKFGAKYYVVPGGRAWPLLAEPGRGLAALAWVVVESELDALMLADAAGHAGLPVGAVSVLSALGKPCPRGHQALRRAAVILVSLDYDQAGGKAAAWWSQTYPQAKRWPTPEAKDPGDFFKAGGDVAGWIREGLPEGLKLARKN